MNHFDRIQSFIERCERGAPVEAVVADFQDTVAQLGVRYFACCTHATDPLDPPLEAVMVHNYPPPWVRVFSDERLYEIDPVLQYAEHSSSPFFWDAPAFRAHLTAEQGKLLVAAAKFGLTHGYTIPIYLSWAPGALCASCSIVPAAGASDARNYFGLQLMASYLYVAVSRAHVSWNAKTPIVLSRRERQCLALVAQGKDDWAVGRLLGVNSATVHTYIERAKRRLHVATRVQAVVQALMHRQISFGDVVRAQETELGRGKGMEHARMAARRRLKTLERLALSRRLSPTTR